MAERSLGRGLFANTSEQNYFHYIYSIVLLGSLIKTAGSSCPERVFFFFFFLEIYRRRPSSKEEENTFIYHHTIPSQLVKKETETSRSVYRYCFSPIIKTYFWCFFASFLIERLMRRARMICIFKFD